MRCLERNKSRFYYALYTGKQPLKDPYGNLTGEYGVVYGNPSQAYANISAAQGETQTRQFGENETYDKVLVMSPPYPNIDELSVLWVDNTPQLEADGSLSVDQDGNTVTPYDYVVKKVAKSLNSVSIAIAKVNVSG